MEEGGAHFSFKLTNCTC